LINLKNKKGTLKMPAPNMSQEQYDSMSKWEKIAYWVITLLGFLTIASLLIYDVFYK
jgi:cell division protein FtsL